MTNKINKSTLIKRVGATLILVALFFITAQNALAEGVGLPNLNVNIEYPYNQDPNVEGYFALNVSGSSVNQDLEFNIRNTSNVSVDYQVEFLNAYTSASGNIQYTDKDSENSVITDTAYELSKYISGPESITLEPNEVKSVKYVLEVPEIAGTGVGGIAFKKADADKIETEEGLVIENEMRVVYGVVVNAQGGNNNDVITKEPYVEPMPSYYTVRLPIENDSTNVINDAVISYQVEDETGKELFQGNKVLKFAPKTRFHLDLPFDTDTIVKDGKYFVTGYIKYDGVTAPIKVDFKNTIDYKGRKNALSNINSNKEDVEVPREIGNWSITHTILLIIFIILILLAIYMYYKSTQDEDEIYEVDNSEEEYRLPKSKD